MTEPQHQALSRGRYAQLSALQFLQYFIWGSWSITAGAYLLHTLHWDGQQVGWVYSSTALGAVVSPLLVGILADRYFSLPRLLGALHLVGGGLMLLLAQTQDFSYFYPLFVAYALVYMPSFSLANALCFHHLAPGGLDFPKVRVWGTVGWIATGVGISAAGWEQLVWPLWLSGGASLVQAAYVLTLPPPPRVSVPTPAARRPLLSPELRDLLRQADFRRLLFALSLLCIPSAFYYSFSSPFLRDVGIARPAGLMAVGQLSEVVLVLALPLVWARWGLKIVILAGAAAWSLRYFLYAGAPAVGLLGLTFAIALHGVAFPFTNLAAQMYINARVSAHLRSTAQGFMTLITNGLGSFWGSLIAGAVVGHYQQGSQIDWAQVWLVPAGIGLLAGGYFWWRFTAADEPPRG